MWHVLGLWLSAVCTYPSSCWTLQNRVLRAFDDMRLRTPAAATISSSITLVIIKTSSFDVPGTGCTMNQYIAQDVQYQGGCRVKKQWCCVVTTGTLCRHRYPLPDAFGTHNCFVQGLVDHLKAQRTLQYCRTVKLSSATKQ